MATYQAGKNGVMTVGGQTLPVKDWSATIKSDKLDTTTTGSSGYREYASGLKVVDANFESYWDSVLYPLATGGPNLIPGSTVSVIFKVDGSSATITCTTFYVESCDHKLSVDGVVTWTVSGSSTGAFTLTT